MTGRYKVGLLTFMLLFQLPFGPVVDTQSTAQAAGNNAPAILDATQPSAQNTDEPTATAESTDEPGEHDDGGTWIILDIIGIFSVLLFLLGASVVIPRGSIRDIACGILGIWGVTALLWSFLWIMEWLRPDKHIFARFLGKVGVGLLLLSAVFRTGKWIYEYFEASDN